MFDLSSQYAIRAVLHLARLERGTLVQAHVIAKTGGKAPARRALDDLMQQLKLDEGKLNIAAGRIGVLHHTAQPPGVIEGLLIVQAMISPARPIFGCETAAIFQRAIVRVDGWPEHPADRLRLRRSGGCRHQHHGQKTDAPHAPPSRIRHRAVQIERAALRAR